ncbi:TonB-dependent receptor [Methylotenera sp. 1P/1]|uniref:TonB-dependent receptor n=1 Tax=Methylotenera sp. 1P/1 TaxID=1131551 RepID=UPI00037D8400|nr:TonB-dependent receptor [Methylotenera sp. 1P/1]
MNKTIIASLIGLAFSNTAFSAENIDLDEITVKANRFERKESETTYASEIHTAKQIETSGAPTLYDYLTQQTSLNVSPNIGNRATPAINMRGFGNENGYQNVVITVDGQRLNNIDLQPALLAGIPLSNIERIEISKGSGSVIYGDGATAGAIQIYTKAKSGVTVNTSLGNFGQKNHAISAGISEQYIDLSANLAHDSYDGFSKKDASGHKDQFTSNSQNAKLKIKPTDFLRFFAEGTSSRNDIRYVNPMTKAQFKDDPKQANGTYNHQSFDTDQWQLGAEWDILKNLQLRAVHYNEDKFSEFISATPSTANSIYKSNDISLRYQTDSFSLITGYQNFDGERNRFSDFFGVTSDKTTKKNEAVYIQGEVKLADWTLSGGARDESVRYNFKPVINPFGTAAAKEKQDIDAWDIGVNYKVNSSLSIFTNYNQAYQAPDIDRLFGFGFGFNGFIEPAKTRTLNLGLNHISDKNRLKVTTFYTKLDDEIFLDVATFLNTNIDRSHKYGFEIQDYFQINEQLSTSLIYNYTRAKIDREDRGAGAYNGKDLPGVPKHSVVANLNWNFFTNAHLNLNHTWRSRAYAFNDLENNFDQRQSAYESTNIALNYQFKNIQLYTAINNLFEHENSIQVADDSIYPVDFVRTWRIGMKADF